MSLKMKGIYGGNWEEMLKHLWAMLSEVMDSQATYLDDNDIGFIGIRNLDVEAKPNKITTTLFLVKLTSRLQNPCITAPSFDSVVGSILGRFCLHT